jgi:hypothetical protein
MKFVVLLDHSETKKGVEEQMSSRKDMFFRLLNTK